MDNGIPPNNADAQAGVALVDDDALSPPLYVAALIASLAALMSINSVLGVDELAVTSILLSILGFAFSFACRWYRVSPKLLDYLALSMTGWLIFRLATGAISIAALVPVSQNQGDLQMAVVLEWLAVIYSWTLVTDRKVVMSSILSIAMIGLVAAYDVNIDLVMYFLAYVVATVFLLIHQNYLLHRSWGKQLDDSGGEWRLLNTQITLSFVCALVVLGVGLVLVVPIKALGAHLSLGTALRGLVDFGAGSHDPPPVTDNFFDDPTFPIGQGGGFSESEETVMRAYPSDRQEHYWRGRTYDQYSSRGWLSTQADQQSPLTPAPSESPSYPLSYSLPRTTADQGRDTAHAQILSTRMDVVSGTTNTLYTPRRPTRVDVGRTMRAKVVISQDGQIGLDAPSSSFTYRVISELPATDVETMRRASTRAVPPQVRRLYIEQRGGDVSPEDSSRLEQTAADIVNALPPTRRDGFDRAEAIRDWVSHRAVYSLDVAAVPRGDDAVSYFLFTSRRGYCDLFASSMALLCRYAGLPARVVTGFAPGVRRADGGFDLRLKDKHAWCEVYFQGNGWYIFDPTSGVTVANTAAQAHTAGEWWRTQISKLKSFLLVNGPVPVALLILVVCSAAYVLKVEVIDRLRVPRRIAKGHRPGAGVDGLSSLEEARFARASAGERWRIVQLTLARWRVRQRPSETTREYSRRVQAAIRRAGPLVDGAAPVRAEDAAAALALLAESHLIARYSASDDLVPVLVARERSGATDTALGVLQDFVASARRRARGSGDAAAASDATVSALAETDEGRALSQDRL